MAARSSVVVLAACLCLWLAVRARRARHKSGRLAQLSLACGLATFVLLERVVEPIPSDAPQVYRAAGVVRIVIAVTGIVLWVRALRRRRQDGAGWKTAVAGILTCLLLHAPVGLFDLTLTASNFTPPPLDGSGPTAWVYRHPEHAVSVTLPSDKWRLGRMKSGEAAFLHNLPRMHAAIVDVKTAQTEADFLGVVARMREAAAKHAEQTTHIRDAEGVNRHGHRYYFRAGLETNPDGPTVFVASSVTYVAGQKLVVVIVLEGLPKMLSQSGRETELRMIQASGEAIALSVQ
jgi:hypothetical protein